MTFWKKKNQEDADTENNDNKNEGIKTSQSDIQPTENESMAIESKDNSAPQQQAVGHEANSISSKLNKVRSALSAGTVIQGKLSFDTPVRIDGKLSGEIHSSKTLIIGETAQINAQIEASELIIYGKVHGEVNVSEKVQICSGAVLEGSINSPSLVIESGAFFNGSCLMNMKSKDEGAVPVTAVYSDDSVDLAVDSSANGTDFKKKKNEENKNKKEQESRPTL